MPQEQQPAATAQQTARYVMIPKSDDEPIKTDRID